MLHYSDYLIETSKAAQGVCGSALYGLARSIFQAWKTGKTVFTCGNGGSYSNAQHLAQDLSKGAWIPRHPRLKTHHLGSNPSALTAWGNDEGYQWIFYRELETRGQQGDLLIAISGSGNSPNVLNAVHMAHELEMHTWGITGFDGGKLANLAHRCVRVPHDDMGRVEVAHDLIFHWLVDYLKEAFQASREHRLSELEAWTPQ